MTTTVAVTRNNFEAHPGVADRRQPRHAALRRLVVTGNLLAASVRGEIIASPDLADAWDGLVEILRAELIQTETTKENSMTTEATAQTTRPPSLLAGMKLAELPRIGAEWPGQGGLFAGLVRGQNGVADYLLILGPEYDGELPWQAAMDWAAGIEIERHKDFTLPTRAEQAVLFGNLRDQFDSEWYWSCEQHAEYGDYAWGQGFGLGYQDLWYESNNYRARAVRRSAI